MLEGDGITRRYVRPDSLSPGSVESVEGAGWVEGSTECLIFVVSALLDCLKYYFELSLFLGMGSEYP